MRYQILGLSLVAGLIVLSAPGTAQAQDSRSDVEIWAQSCSSCHAIQPARRYTADQWGSIMVHMKLTANLTDAESAAVLRFMSQGARKQAGTEEDYQAAAALSARVDRYLSTLGTAVAEPPRLAAEVRPGRPEGGRH
jgi:Dihaem cytochrome c